MGGRTRHSARVDTNHAGIRDHLRNNGFTVQDFATAGEGFPDLLVSFPAEIPGVGTIPYTVALEVKKPNGDLNPRQRKWFRGWQGAKAVVQSKAEAVELCRHLRNGRFEVLRMEPFYSRLPTR